MPTDVPFGAVGDGAHDDWKAIQAAVDSVGRAGGGTVALPAGRFLLSATVELALDNVSVRGAGIGRTVLIVGPGQNSAALLAAGTPPMGFVRNVHASDFTVDGNRANNSKHYIGIFWQRVQGGSIERVESKESTDIGLGFGDASIEGPTTRDVLVLGCWAHDNGGNGFDAANVTRIRFIANRADGNGTAKGMGGAGFFTGHGSTSDVEYVGNVAERNAGAGFQASSGRPDAEDRYTEGIRYIANTSRANTPSAISDGEAFLLNRGGRGPTRMSGPYEFVANWSSCNHREGVVTAPGVSGLTQHENQFAAPDRCASP